MLKARRFWLSGLAIVLAVALHALWTDKAPLPPAGLRVLTGASQLDGDPELAALLDSRGENDTVPPIDPVAVRLIDRLVDAADEGVGTHSTAWVSAFLATDEEPRFGGGVLGSHPPATNPAMRDLVRMGLAAVPALLEHLSDGRKTKLVVGCNGIIEWARFGDEYGPRYADPRKWPHGINSGKRDRFVNSHSLRVADLCYVVLGQIVNRGLCAVRYQPTGGMIINSPIVTPALAAAARKDWASLTPARHRRLLIADALRQGCEASALRRLCFYYPQAGEVLAVRLLTGQRYDTEPARKFVVEQLLEDKDPHRWLMLIEAFAKSSGPASAVMIPYWLNRVCEESGFPKRTAKDRELEDTARQVLAAVYPWHDPEHPTFVNAAEDEDKAAIIDALVALAVNNARNSKASRHSNLCRSRRAFRRFAAVTSGCHSF